MTTASTQDYADQSIEQGSQSFAAAARLFDKETRQDVTKLYAWCRYCDDVVDGQVLGHGTVVSPHSQQQRLAELTEKTLAALEGGPVKHPAFAGLRDIAQHHELPRALPLAHLEGFRADVEHRRYQTLPDLMVYCYGVAGVVGIMMADIMGVRDPAVLDRACDLGLAFQLTNISRDIVEDAENGRIYVPLDWLDEASIPVDEVAASQHRDALASVARRLVQAAEPYYASAQVGIGALPFRSRLAIATALYVYRAIGQEVVKRGARAWDERVSTSTLQKSGFALKGLVKTLKPRSQIAKRRDETLWKRPKI
ncbi:phytoene/squalene synthase family protein [Tianweitania sp. BSSL-BM11]|uniref:Phytoene/squalene synthase family protein n=1 Tax=Tianweitania aestuarii TaxID=2814886 RepID=A0ABS5RPX9_9HYPH|nr:phytoene/squalene synthase family protein [Tianweitania aestuarii]MBS9719088.1 phytoene/squalene synthase family protein [Tianweitania aestuarii]